MWSRIRTSATLLLLLAFSPVLTAAEPVSAAPAFELPPIHPDATPVALSDYAGKIVYLDFWSVWCAPCRDSLPELAELQNTFGDDPFAVVTVNLDHVPADARRFLEQASATFATAMDPGRTVAEAYGVEVLPHAVLLDQKGRIRSVYRAGEYGNKQKLQQDISDLLAEASPARPDRSAGRSLLARWGLAD